MVTPTFAGSPPAAPIRRALPPLAEHVGLLLVLALLVALFGLTTDHFFTPLTFTTLANQVPALTVIAVGMTLVLVAGGIDLSVGSVLSLGAAVLAVALTDGRLPLAAAIGLGLAVGAAAGAINGAVTVRWSVPSFIVTVGMLEIARGGAYLVTGSRSVFVGSAIGGIGSPLPGVGLSPAFLLALAVVAAGHLLLTRTVFGRYLVAIGTNAEAVRLSGIDPRPAPSRCPACSPASAASSTSPISSRPIRTAASASSCRRSRPWSSAAPA